MTVFASVWGDLSYSFGYLLGLIALDYYLTVPAFILLFFIYYQYRKRKASE